MWKEAIVDFSKVMSRYSPEETVKNNENLIKKFSSSLVHALHIIASIMPVSCKYSVICVNQKLRPD